MAIRLGHFFTGKIQKGSGKDKRTEKRLKNAVKTGIERYFRSYFRKNFKHFGVATAEDVPDGLLRVSYDQGLEIAYNIEASISDNARRVVLSAIKAILMDSSVSLLGEVNEQGYPVRYIGPYRMVKIPKGVSARGAADLHAVWYINDCPPGLVELTKDYWIAETATIEGLYRLFGIEGGNRNAPPDHPATGVSWNQAIAHIKAVNEFFGIKKLYGIEVGLPTEAQHERAARGQWVNIIEQMKKEGVPITHEEFIKFVAERYENFVIANRVEDIRRGMQIFTDDLQDQDSKIWEALKDNDVSIFGMRQYGTRSGKLTHKEAWYYEGVSLDKRIITSANWSPPNGWGLNGTCGSVWEWVQDFYYRQAYALTNIDPKAPDRFEGDGEQRTLRGVSCFNPNDNSEVLRAAFRGHNPSNNSNSYIGFRVSAPQDS